MKVSHLIGCYCSTGHLPSLCAKPHHIEQYEGYWLFSLKAGLPNFLNGPQPQPNPETRVLPCSKYITHFIHSYIAGFSAIEELSQANYCQSARALLGNWNDANSRPFISRYSRNPWKTVCGISMRARKSTWAPVFESIGGKKFTNWNYQFINYAINVISPAYKLFKSIASMPSYLGSFSSSHLKHNSDLVSKLWILILSPSDRFISFDAVSLFTNVSLDPTLQVSHILIIIIIADYYHF